MDIGARIRWYREALAMTQEALAQQTGIVASSISKLENGTRKLPFDEAVRLAKAFGVELEALADVASPTLPQLALAAQRCRVIRDELTVITQQVHQLEQVLTILKEHSGEDPSSSARSGLVSAWWSIPLWTPTPSCVPCPAFAFAS